MSTKIPWADESWNVIVGCSKVSAGCQNCYAERMARRQAAMGNTNYRWVTSNGKWAGKTTFVESALEKPFHWRNPRTIFVVSMGDLFHETVPFEWIEKVMGVIEQCPQHFFYMLTKRPHIMAEYFNGLGKSYELSCCPNLCLGVTVENQKAAAERIPILLKIPAAQRFISFEPLLEALTLWPLDIRGISVGFIGCESGPGARLCKQDAILDLRYQLSNANVKVGIKQIPLNGKCSKFENRDQWPEDLRVWEIEHEQS
jgi:protein gp37